MRGNRNKIDWSRPFKFIESKKVFDELETNDENQTMESQREEKTIYKKENIPVPEIEAVKHPMPPKGIGHIAANYIRLSKKMMLPRANEFELTEVDYVFIQGHQDKFKLNGRPVLTADFLAKTFVELETKAGKSEVIPLSKGWIVAFIEREFKELLRMDHFNSFAECVYNFWKNRREEVKFPLLRLLWRPSPEDCNQFMAFKPRYEDKRSLRRANRGAEDEIVETLLDDFVTTEMIMERVQAREDLKLKQTLLSVTAFHQECKGFFSWPDFLSEITLEQRAKDKERVKKMHSDLAAFKLKKEVWETETVNDNIENIFNQKQTVINFLSTVTYEAELQGLSYDKIFAADKPKVIAPPTIMNAPPLIEVPARDIPILLDECLSLRLRRIGDIVMREFDDGFEGETEETSYKNLIDYKQKKVSKYYFGKEDEGDYKDLRKNVSASFKKFLSLNKTSINE